ncbi:MAG TPA: lysylphosphatidylglycerol synthase transmembrane domain-containing protein [Gemmatimonadaceae bacterium]|nr:lysylphosphatidylglycerol synthase transmembrane domain-containing protein [Gemmatimonadaceae bacterium]
MIQALAARRGGRALAIFAMCGLFVASLYRMDLARALAQLASVRAGWLALALLCYVAILPLWAVQWHLLSPPDPTRRVRVMLGVVATTSSVLNTTPMLVGEATGVALLVTRTRLDRSAALSVLAMDQLLVGVAKVTVLATAALIAPLPDWMTRAVLALLVALSVLGGSLLLASWRHADVASVMSRVGPVRLAGALGAFAASLEPLRVPARGAPALALALLKKAVEVAAILCVQRAFGVALPLGTAVVVLAVLNLATLLPVVPGNVGVFEAAVVLALTRFGVPAEQALGIAVVQHLCYFVALAAPGLAWTARGR